MKHTPGPWIAEEIGITDMGPNGLTVYEVRTEDSYRRIVDAAGREDALLIAAAPELLAALTEYMAAVDQMNAAMKDGVNVHGALAALVGADGMARAAIAKATGS